jgi:aldehyde:ferredoxin oxidoreductase
MPKGKGGIPAWAVGPIGWLMGKLPTKMRMDGLMSLPAMSQWGTAAGNEVCVATGDASVRNWRGYAGQYPMRAIGLQKIIPTQIKKYHCVACPLGCGSITSIKGKYGETHRPEYETAAGFGPNLLNRDLDSIYYLNELCNRLGLDSISTSSVIAFAIDCATKGLLTPEQIDGLSLGWGQTKGIIQLVNLIARREGCGDLFAEGVRIAAERIGPASQAFAFHAGGQELPYHDPRIDPTYGVYYVSDPTPGRHTIGSSTEYEMFALWRKVSWAPEPPQQYPKSRLYQCSPENAQMAAAGAIYKALIDCAGVCTFGAHIGADRFGFFETLNAAFGFSYTPDEYMEIGRRIQSERQRFNRKHGIVPEAVTINPVLTGQPPASRGPARGLQYDLSRMRSAYWDAMGWDGHTGDPDGNWFQP